MNIVKFMTKDKLVEYLDEELRLFLNDKEIYELNQYGWLNDDRPDPEYIGLAMWQTSPPTSHSKVTKIRKTLKTPAFSQAELGRIFKSGLEFEELMKSARHSIGLTHLFHNSESDLNQCFNYHYSDAVMKLDRATARLRDFFIDVFGIFLGFDITDGETTPPHSPTELRHIFCRPFKETRDKLAAAPDQYEELLSCLEDLIPLVEQTPLNHMNREELQDSSLSEETVPPGISEWYKLLVKESSQIFLAEYLLRNSNTQTTIPDTALSN